MQHGNGSVAGLVRRRSAQTAAWPKLGAWAPQGAAKESAAALANVRKQLAQAKLAALPRECIWIMGEKLLQEEETAMRHVTVVGAKDGLSTSSISQGGDRRQVGFGHCAESAGGLRTCTD